MPDLLIHVLGGLIFGGPGIVLMAVVGRRNVSRPDSTPKGYP